MNRGRVTGPLGRRGRILGGMAFCVGALVLSIVAGAFASTLNYVVPPTGQVFGKPYRYWEERVWKIYYESPAPGPKPCQTVSVGGHTAVLVENITGGKSTCQVPAGAPIYINEYTTTCSSLPGQHDGYGTTDPDLQKCSRFQKDTTRALITVKLDGRKVPDFGREYFGGNKAFPVTVPPGRFKGVSQTQARTADWGWTLLLKRLPKGTHAVTASVLHPNRQHLRSSDVTLHVG